MRRLGTFLMFVLISCGAVSGQSDKPAKGWGKGYGGIGAAIGDGESLGILHLGGGFAGLLKGGLGAEVDIGYLAPLENSGSGVGVFSPGILYAFQRENRTVPYIGGGYSLFFRESAAHGFYVAGGVNHWFSNRWGIQVEARDQVLPEYNEHFLEARFSVLIR